MFYLLNFFFFIFFVFFFFFFCIFGLENVIPACVVWQDTLTLARAVDGKGVVDAVDLPLPILSPQAVHRARLA